MTLKTVTIKPLKTQYRRCFAQHFLLSISHLIVLQDGLRLDDEKELGQEYKRLQQAMEMVGFLASTKKQYV